MTSRQPLGRAHQHLMRVMRVVPFWILLGLAGCAQMNKVKSQVSDQWGGHSAVVVTPAAAPAATVASGTSSLTTIVNDELQLGHYGEGEKALRRYLKQHPGDRPAQAMLRQLTADPVQLLGRQSRAHVVQTGDSYSTLAAHYLGDPSQFLILARYNGSTNPSILRVGETLRLPMSVADVSTLPEASAPGAGDNGRLAVADTAAGTAQAIFPGTAPAIESAAVKAKRLQQESLALFDHGHREQALARLDEALLIEPRLKPAGAESVALRKQLLATHHQLAIVLYRDQQLDQAIALWDHVLAIEPNYEPATIYRARALELKRRLKQF